MYITYRLISSQPSPPQILFSMHISGFLIPIVSHVAFVGGMEFEILTFKIGKARASICI